MKTATNEDPSGRWIGRMLGALVTLVLLADGAVNLFAPSMFSNEMVATGFPPELSGTLGVLILVCAILYAIPQTCVLGAILITGFLGGAICTHLRLGEVGSPPQIVSIVLGIAAWASLYLRLQPVRVLLPVVRPWNV